MSAAVWDRNAGRFDRPSSAVPTKRDTGPDPHGRRLGIDLATSRAKLLQQREADARRQGVSPVNAHTILHRIDDAMLRMVEKGHGDGRAIYLTDADLVAFRQVCPGASEHRDLPVHSGAESFVYNGRGRVRIRKRPTGPAR